MTTTFQVESWDQYYGDPQRQELWLEHYAELRAAHGGMMEMSPDIPTFRALDASGALIIMVARDAGRMIGYCLVVVRPHLHYSRALCAFEDSYFVTASARVGWTGYKLLKYTLLAVKRRGCVRAFFMTKEFASVEGLLRRLGMSKTDSIYAVWLSEVS